MESHWIGGKFQGEEAVKGKLHNTQSDSSSIIPERTHGEATWQESSADKGGGDRGGGGVAVYQVVVTLVG